MSVTNSIISTNRVTAGVAEIGTLNAGSLNVRSGSVSLTTLTTNTLTANNVYVTGDLSGQTIMDILHTQWTNENDISVNNYRIADLSEGIASNSLLIESLSGEISDIKTDISNLNLDEFQDLSGRVLINETDISDLSGRINDIVVGSNLVTRTEFAELSGRVLVNESDINDLSGEIDILRSGFITEIRYQELSQNVVDNFNDITDICQSIIDLIADIGISTVVTNSQFNDLSDRVLSLEVDVSNILQLEIDVSDLSGRIEVQENLVIDLSNSVDDLYVRSSGIDNSLNVIEGSYIIRDSNVGIRVNPSSEEFKVIYNDTSANANVVIGLSSDAIVFNGNTTFRGQVQFQDVVSVPANTILINSSGITNIDYLSTTPYSHTEYIMFDTSGLNALTYYDGSINPDSAEVHIRFSRLSKSRNIFISCPPGVLSRLVFELYDDDTLTDGAIVRQEGNIIVQPGAIPIGYNGTIDTVTALTADKIQDYSSDPYRYLYDICDNRGNMGRFFYTQGVVIPVDDVSQHVGLLHPNSNGNRMDISFYGDVLDDMSGLAITERYHRYYQTGSYQFNLEYVSPGIESLRNRAHLFVKETSRIRPLRYAERTNTNVEITQSNESELQLIMARLLFLSNDQFNNVSSMLNSYLDNL